MASTRGKEIRVRVSDEEYDQIDAQAKAVGMTTSGYVRTCAVSNATTANSGNAATFAVTSPPGIYTTTVSPVEMSQLASRVASLEDAIAQGQSALQKKPTT